METKMLYDYDYASDDSGRLYEVFRVKDGKRVAYADSVEEAMRIIDTSEKSELMG